MNLWKAYCSGVFGELGQAHRDYINYCKTHELGQILIAANSKKKYTPKKPISFEQYAETLISFVEGQTEQVTKEQEIQASILGMFGEVKK